MERGEHGFTLLEILVVVMIIGLLMVLLASQLLGRFTDAQADMAALHIKKLENLIELYKIDNGRYPTVEQGLDALVQEPQLEPLPRRYPDRGYASAGDLDDPWGTPYQYELPGAHNTRGFDLYSLGPDGQPQTEDDVGNWDSET